MSLRIQDLDRSVQGRVQLNPSRVASYVARLQSGSRPPPILVVKIGSILRLADGNHRVEAEEIVNGREAEIQAIVVDGNEEFALEQMAKCNRDHGEPLTDADQHHLGLMLLRHDKTRPDEEIAHLLGVAAETVAAWRAEVPGAVGAVRMRKNGRRYTPPTPKPPPTAAECSKEIPEIRRLLLAAMLHDLEALSGNATCSFVAALAKEYRVLQCWLKRRAKCVVGSGATAEGKHPTYKGKDSGQRNAA